MPHGAPRLHLLLPRGHLQSLLGIESGLLWCDASALAHWLRADPDANVKPTAKVMQAIGKKSPNTPASLKSTVTPQAKICEENGHYGANGVECNATGCSYRRSCACPWSVPAFNLRVTGPSTRKTVFIPHPGEAETWCIWCKCARSRGVVAQVWATE